MTLTQLRPPGRHRANGAPLTVCPSRPLGEAGEVQVCTLDGDHDGPHRDQAFGTSWWVGITDGGGHRRPVRRSR